MHSIIYFCLFALFITIKCIEISECGTTEKIRFEGKEDTEIAEIKNNDNLKKIHDLGERLAMIIYCLICVRYDILCRANMKVSFNIDKINNESPIDTTNKKNRNENKFADTFKADEEESCANTFWSSQKNLEEIRNFFTNNSTIFHDDPNSGHKQILLSKNELNSLINSLKIMEAMTWCLYVEMVDEPSDVANREREDILKRIAQNDLEWKKNWDDLLFEIHRLLNDTSSRYDGVVPLSISTFSKFSCALKGLCMLLPDICEKVGGTMIKAMADSEIGNKISEQLLGVLESLYSENNVRNTNILQKTEGISNESTADKSSSHMWSFIGIGAVLAVVLLVVVFFLYKKCKD